MHINGWALVILIAIVAIWVANGKKMTDKEIEERKRRKESQD
jgi:hypothetical protein